MKKKVISLVALGAMLVGGATALTSCGNKQTDAKTFYSKYCDGEIGDYTKKEGVDGNITVSGYFTVGGDGNYWSGYNGYIVGDNGVNYYIHNISEEAKETAPNDIKPGAKLQITGTFDVYNGLPQIVSYTYKVLEAAPTDPTALSKLMDSLFHTVTDEEYTIISKKGNIVGNYEWALRPVKLVDMVNITPITNGTTLSFVPLAYVGTDKQDDYTITVYRAQTTGEVDAGGLWTIYGGVTAYKGTPQLHVGSLSDSNITFKGLQEQEFSTLDDAKKMEIVNLKTETSLGGSFSWKNGESGNLDTTGVKTQFNILTGADLGSEFESVGIQYEILEGSEYIEQTSGGRKVIKLLDKYRTVEGATELLKGGTTATITAKVKRTITVGSTTKEFTDSYTWTYTLISKLTSLSQSFIATKEQSDAKEFFAGWKYITNNDKYPDPGYGTYGGTEDLALKIYQKGGFQTEMGYDESVQLKKSELDKIAVEVAAYNGQEFTEDGKIDVTLYGTDNQTVIGTAVILVTKENIGKTYDTALYNRYEVTEIQWDTKVTDETVIGGVKVISNEASSAYQLGFKSFELVKKAA